MRILDRSKLVPHLLEELPAEVEERIALVTREKFAMHGRSQETDEFGESLAWARERARRGRADSAWLSANLPAGTVFDHLGATVMVIRHETQQDIPGPFGRSELCAVLDMQTPRGVESVVRSVAELRAMLEPDFVVNKKGRNC